MSRGRFITFEGIEGVGKSTGLQVFVEQLEASGLKVHRTREPGGTAMAEQIRAILKHRGEEPMPPVAELLLNFAARAINVANAIAPALAAGEWVVADRFTDATRAYQGAGRGIDSDWIETLASWVHMAANPDVTVLLDAPAEIGLARVQQRGNKDRYETEDVEFFERVRARYLELAASEPARFVVIDATQALPAVTERIREVAAELASVED